MRRHSSYLGVVAPWERRDGRGTWERSDDKCLPWFEGSDCWCTSCAGASCFTVLLRNRDITQKTIDFKVERLVEGEGSHVCDLVYELAYEIAVFYECW